MARFRDIVKVTAGQAAPKEFSNIGFPFIRAGHLEELIEGKSASDLPKVTEQISKMHKLNLLPKNSIIFAKSGMSATKNRIFILNEPAYFVSHLAAILPNDKIHMSYLARFLFWFNPTNLVLDEAYPSIRLEDINNLEIPLPPLPQQQKIANILDAADELRQNDKKLIAKYDELTQALFLDMFGDPVSNPKGWEKVELNKLCSFKKKSIKPEDIKAGQNYVALDSVEKVTGNIITVYNVEKYELKSNKFWFDDSYILYGKLRPYLNKVALPDFEGICSTDIIPIQPINKKSNKLFITSILRHNSFVAFADERSSGANLPRISPSEVEKYSTINPPIILQNQFAERVTLIEEQKAIAQKSLEKSEDLFNSLLQKAFNGELI